MVEDSANEQQQLSGLDEFGLIRRLADRLPAPGQHIRIGIGDDAAVVVHETGADLLITTDTMVDGVHFLTSTMGWEDVGWKAIAVSISDIAAMGGVPQSVVLSLAIPKTLPLPALEAVYDGIAAVSRQYGCPVVGGDVVSTSGPFVITSTVTGTVPSGQAVLRSGAQPGDIVFVTGHVGGSAAGLAFLQSQVRVPDDEAMQLCAWHQHPLPQVEAGSILRESGATSCNDISDGLASELNEIAEASRVRIRIQADRIPIAPATRNLARRLGSDALDYALYGGEDYQLVGTAPSIGFARALARCQSVGIALTQIGRVEPGEGVVAQMPNGALDLIQPRGYNHFRAD